MNARLSVLAILLAIIPSTLRAADAPPPTTGPAVRIARTLTDLQDAVMSLNLSDDQRKKAEDIFTEARTKLEAMVADFQKNRPSREDTMAAIRKFTDEVKAKLEAILDEGQKQKLAEKVAAIRSNFGAMRGGLADMLKQRLGEMQLSDEQKQKVEKIIEDTRQKLQEIRQNTTDRRQIVEKFLAIRDEVGTRLKEVLTPEQFDKIKEAFQNRQPGNTRPPERAN